jgi:hypothetical protein
MSDDNQQRVQARADSRFDEHFDSVERRTDRLFAYLMMAQWAFAVLLALVVSPYGWEGKASAVHYHVYIALGMGGLINALPVTLAFLKPGAPLTRHVIAAAQMTWSALLIHLTGGRIETHFHVFGSLAFVAFYRDWRVLITATVTVAGDHFFRGLYWPESVYGIANPEWWRFLEHASWVVFIDSVLVLACIEGLRDMRAQAQRQAEAEVFAEMERERAMELDMALTQLRGASA